MSETMRVSWDHVWRMPVIEFLNVIAYRRDKAEDEKIRIKQWQRHN